MLERMNVEAKAGLKMLQQGYYGLKLIRSAENEPVLVCEFEARRITAGMTQAWELDALPPEKLSAMFESAIESLTDFQELERMQDKEKADKTYFSELL